MLNGVPPRPEEYRTVTQTEWDAFLFQEAIKDQAPQYPIPKLGQSVLLLDGNGLPKMIVTIQEVLINIRYGYDDFYSRCYRVATPEGIRWIHGERHFVAPGHFYWDYYRNKWEANRVKAESKAKLYTAAVSHFEQAVGLLDRGELVKFK